MLENILCNVLTALYQPFGFSVFAAILLMVLYLYAKDHGSGVTGLKAVIIIGGNQFKSSSTFRRLFCLSFYIMMILFRTLMNRNMWMNPLSDVMGGWILHNSKGELTTEAIENVILFLPFMVLLLWLLKEQLNLKYIVQKSIQISFLFSVGIEFAQLFLRLGTFQLSDIFYNTLGGCLGGIVYWMIKKSNKRNKGESYEL